MELALKNLAIILNIYAKINHLLQHYFTTAQSDKEIWYKNTYIACNGGRDFLQLIMCSTCKPSKIWQMVRVKT